MGPVVTGAGLLLPISAAASRVHGEGTGTGGVGATHRLALLHVDPPAVRVGREAIHEVKDIL